MKCVYTSFIKINGTINRVLWQEDDKQGLIFDSLSGTVGLGMQVLKAWQNRGWFRKNS